MGVDVIQVESRQRLDSWRGGTYNTMVPEKLRHLPAAVHGWNTQALYNSVNHSKRVITINLSYPDGIALYKRLVPYTDLIIENFSPRVIGNLGLSFETLREIKPDIVLVSMAAYGHSGPYENTPGIGGTIEPMSGMSNLLGYEDGPPLNSGLMYPDPIAGMFGAIAGLLALRHRDRTGEGQHVDLSMQEANTIFIGDAMVDFAVNRRVRSRIGNHHVSLAPHNMYPCRDGHWIAIAATDEAQWQTLCRLAGHEEWARDARFADNATRKQNEAALDELIGAWTRGQDAFALEEMLSAAGVTAAAARDAREVASMPQLINRGFIVKLRHPETGELQYTGAPMKMSVSTPAVVTPAPLQGEHSWEVFHDLLGMTETEYERLVELGITGTGPPPDAD
jgi:crotonobetainyl-CoA:carnitine CoA-transferase CaiB-like acyl-CoA transferase